MYPAPPNLSKHEHFDPAEVFWVIKHGVKASGMPAWGKRMEDKYVWDLVAFLRQLPTLSPEQYATEVAASGGHSHGGGESTSGDAADGKAHDEASHDHPTEDGARGVTHTHADGKQHEHGRAPAPVAAAKALQAALSSGDAERVREFLDPQVLIFESGNVERSRQEFASHHLPSDLKFMKAVNYELVRQSGGAVGDLAWVASEARLTGSPQGRGVEVASTETLVLRKAASGWKVVHVHWSSREKKKQ